MRFVQISEFQTSNVSAASEAIRLTRNALSKFMHHCNLDASHCEWPAITSQNKDGAPPYSRQFESCFRHFPIGGATIINKVCSIACGARRTYRSVTQKENKKHGSRCKTDTSGSLSNVKHSEPSQKSFLLFRILAEIIGVEHS